MMFNGSERPWRRSGKPPSASSDSRGATADSTFTRKVPGYGRLQRAASSLKVAMSRERQWQNGCKPPMARRALPRLVGLVLHPPRLARAQSVARRASATRRLRLPYAECVFSAATPPTSLIRPLHMPAQHSAWEQEGTRPNNTCKQQTAPAACGSPTRPMHRCRAVAPGRHGRAHVKASGGPVLQRRAAPLEPRAISLGIAARSLRRPAAPLTLDAPGAPRPNGPLLQRPARCLWPDGSRRHDWVECTLPF